jgi:outer membrane protein TolC
MSASFNSAPQARQYEQNRQQRRSNPVSPAAIGDETAGLTNEAVIPMAAAEAVIDLPTALRLAEAENPSIGAGREAIREALALQVGARGMMLPSLNAGTTFHFHEGALQTSFGEVRTLSEDSLYIGGGARVWAAETVGIPAVRIFGHLADAYYSPLVAAQVVNSRQAESRSTTNTVLLDVVQRYLALLGAEGELEAIHLSEANLREVISATAAFAKAGQGRLGDYNRARTDALLLHAQEQRAQENAYVASADLARTLHLDPSTRLRTGPGSIEVVQLVDRSHRLEELIQMAQTSRPEVAARAADVQAADYRLQEEYARPFLPLVSVGFSGGAYGGGSDRQDLGVSSMFQHLGGRTDADVYAVWTLQNLGLGNAALQKGRRAERDDATARRGLILAQIGREVADSYAEVEARRQQLELTRQRVQTAVEGEREEIARVRTGEGLPLEAINSVDLLTAARREMVQALIAYNLAEFELFVALGETPNAALPDPLRNESNR